jgi:hypothetical protein
MSLMAANRNQSMHWSERSRPDQLFIDVNRTTRSPGPDPTVSDSRDTPGAPYEHIVTLSNLANKSIWITVPHLETDNYVRNLAILILYGSNGRQPYAIQDYVYNARIAPWGPRRQLSYHNSSDFQDDIDIIFKEWQHRLLSGSKAQGGGFDLTSEVGGFSHETTQWLKILTYLWSLMKAAPHFIPLCMVRNARYYTTIHEVHVVD